MRPKKYAPPRARPDSPTAGALAAGSRSARGRAGLEATKLSIQYSVTQCFISRTYLSGQ